MSVRVNNIILDIEEDISLVKTKTAKKLRLREEDINDFKILRESVDARKKNEIKFNYTVEFSFHNEEKLVKRLKNKDIKIEKVKTYEEFTTGYKKLNNRPIIVGMGPAGMFAGLLMAQKGYKPIIIERGESVEARTQSINRFWQRGRLNLDSNIQFGEGGAGTFSDGKLTTRIKDPRCDFVLEQFVKHGAPKEIIYKGKPHIGTDILKEVVKNIRNTIIELGGNIYFNSKLENIIAKDNRIKSIVVNGKEIPCDILMLAIGHSARDTYEMLYHKQILMESKPFAIGVRIEHLQEMINKNQYGKFAGHPRLGAADYRLTYNTKNQRGVYSFCMCPGGYVVAAASEEGKLVTNGMSNYKRDGKNANAAIVVSVTPEDFSDTSPLEGMEFQRKYEELAYKLSGEGYMAPVQLVGDFMNDKKSSKVGKIEPTYKPGYVFGDLSYCLPKFVVDSLKEGLYNFNKKIKGFADSDAVLTGIETRTSAPLRILRNEKSESVSLKGMYPAGEGAGYAGGIVSAAVDGIRTAENIMKQWAPVL